MAKSGVYLHGRELLDCQLEQLSEVKRVEALAETYSKIPYIGLASAFKLERPIGKPRWKTALIKFIHNI